MVFLTFHYLHVRNNSFTFRMVTNNDDDDAVDDDGDDDDLYST